MSFDPLPREANRKKDDDDDDNDDNNIKNNNNLNLPSAVFIEINISN